MIKPTYLKKWFSPQSDIACWGRDLQMQMWNVKCKKPPRWLWFPWVETGESPGRKRCFNISSNHILLKGLEVRFSRQGSSWLASTEERQLPRSTQKECSVTMPQIHSWELQTIWIMYTKWNRVKTQTATGKTKNKETIKYLHGGHSQQGVGHLHRRKHPYGSAGSHVFGNLSEGVCYSAPGGSRNHTGEKWIFISDNPYMLPSSLVRCSFK